MMLEHYECMNGYSMVYYYLTNTAAGPWNSLTHAYDLPTIAYI